LSFNNNIDFNVKGNKNFNQNEFKNSNCALLRYKKLSVKYIIENSFSKIKVIAFKVYYYLKMQNNYKQINKNNIVI